jgi:hypothetical protein
LFPSHSPCFEFDKSFLDSQFKISELRLPSASHRKIRAGSVIFLTFDAAMCDSKQTVRRCVVGSAYIFADQKPATILEGREMAYDVEKLLSMSQSELDTLFTNSPVGKIPDGEAEGTAIVAPGTTFSPAISRFINLFAWQGKVFDAQKGVLKNKILPLGLNAIIAKVYKGPSWLDGKECIVLDYSDTSIVAQWIRDEIREIEPGLYLGKVYWDKKRLIDFALKF